ncbi:hypothetical protein TNCV_22391 [Trichonephila clavipes]|nr:hypothetical protein TNCV_22391 [Trichonephila clavipes]
MSFLVLCEGDTRNRWRDGQVCPDVGQGIMAPWARRPGCVSACYAQIGRGGPRDFCDLPIRRDEGRVVNTPLVFKRVLFQERGEKTGGRERRRKRRGEKESREREEPALDGEKGLVRDWSGKTMNAGGVENGIWTDYTGLADELNSITTLTNCLANKQCFYFYIRL